VIYFTIFEKFSIKYFFIPAFFIILTYIKITNMQSQIKAQDGKLVSQDNYLCGVDIENTLTEQGVKPQYLLWTHPHVLEVKLVTNKDYEEALGIMRMECPTEASSLFGITGERELLFQF